jgi:hypothetical protein
MELSPWEATSRLATQEFPDILWNPEIYNRIRKSPPLVLILSQINPVHTTPFYTSKINLIFSHLFLGILVVFFLLAIPTKSHVHSSSPVGCYMRSLHHPPWLDRSKLISCTGNYSRGGSLTQDKVRHIYTYTYMTT